MPGVVDDPGPPQNFASERHDRLSFEVRNLEPSTGSPVEMSLGWMPAYDFILGLIAFAAPMAIQDAGRRIDASE